MLIMNLHLGQSQLHSHSHVIEIVLNMYIIYAYITNQNTSPQMLPYIQVLVYMYTAILISVNDYIIHMYYVSVLSLILFFSW